jgi:hypothetical protein
MFCAVNAIVRRGISICEIESLTPSCYGREKALIICR